MSQSRVWAVVCLAAGSLAAQPAAKPAGVPAAAVKVDEGYRYTDAQGRQWIYRQTPFGLSRVPVGDPAPAAKNVPPPESFIKAVDHGDKVSFERPGPFGVYRWERKKSEMDATERAAWQRQAAAEADRK